jgi:CRISPR-associated protein Cmr4
MYRKAHPLFIICQTPTHVGSGSELGVVDLPIQRERHTGFPKFEASGLKGCLREAFERSGADALTIHRIFGYDGDSATEAVDKQIPEKERQFSGAVGFTDARLLLFPVKSMKGVFAWVTCLRVLKQFQLDMQLVNPDFRISELDSGHLKADKTYLFSANSNVREGKYVLLEEYTFEVENELNGLVKVNGANFPDWLAKHLFNDDGSYWSEKMKKDIVVLPDNDFKDFVNLSTEVVTRTKIDNETGTVARGALFNEEYLPAESILYSLVLTAAEFKQNGLTEEQVREFFAGNLQRIKTFQIGANATLGKGIVTTKLIQI